MLPTPENVTVYPLDGAQVAINPYPSGQIALPMSLDVDVVAVVEQARQIARDNGKDTIAWWIAPEHDSLAPAFEAVGVVNKDTPGFEATENAMALIHEPRGDRPDGVELRTIRDFTDYQAVAKVVEANFGYPPQSEDAIRKQYEDYLASEWGETFLAIVDGKVVGSAFAAYGEAGVNLFGGSVLEEARGRGIYRALTFARWDKAVERGTPALTVQAGKMSMPICASLGFEWIDAARVFVDDLV